MASPISVQLYSVRDLAKDDFAKVLEDLASIGYTGVEPAGFHDLTPGKFRAVVADLGLTVSSAHGALPIGEHVNQILDEQEAIGNKYLITGFGPETFETEEKIRAAADRFSEAAANAALRGVELGYHNHWWEFDHEFGGKTGHQIFMEAVDPDVFAEIDIYWVATAGKDPVAVIQALGDRAPLLHVKDGPCEAGKPMTPVGSGKVNIRAALSASDAVRWHIVELDECATDMMDALRQSYQFLTSAGLSHGRI